MLYQFSKLISSEYRIALIRKISLVPWFISLEFIDEATGKECA